MRPFLRLAATAIAALKGDRVIPRGWPMADKIGEGVTVIPERLPSRLQWENEDEGEIE